MAKTTPRQRKSVGRVMHEFKHGELKSGPGGRAGKVRNPRQAIAIALHEAGASKYESAGENKRNLKRTERKEARGQTAQQEAEGKSRVGARGRRESSAAMRAAGRKTKAKPRKARGTSRGAKASPSRRRSPGRSSRHRAEHRSEM